MLALAHGVVAGGAGAGLACAVYAQVVAVAAGAGGAFVVVAVVFAVCVAVVQVVHVVQVNDCGVTAGGTVGVGVCLGVYVGAHLVLLCMGINISDDVANVVVFESVDVHSPVRFAFDHVGVQQDAQVVRGERLRDPQAGVQFAHAVLAVHEVVCERQAERMRQGGKDFDGGTKFLGPVFAFVDLDGLFRGCLRRTLVHNLTIHKGLFIYQFDIAIYENITCLPGVGAN